MITTNSFPNNATPAPNEKIERNSLTKEDLEGGVKKNVSTYQNININGGDCHII